MKREHRILFTSWSATVIIASVLAGLAVSVLAECSLRPGMRVLGEADGFTSLPDVEIGLIRARGRRSPIIEAMAQHILESLDNLTSPGFEGEIRLKRAGAGLQPRW